MHIYLYYTGATILLAGADAYRIRVSFGKTANINHTVSWGIAGLLAGILWLVAGTGMGWPLIAFIIACVCIRGALYSPMLNMFRGKRADYISPTTSAVTDHWFNRLSFWAVRGIFAGILGIILLINYLTK